MTPDIDKFFRILTESKEPAYDVETTGLDWKRCVAIGYSISDGKEAEYIPVRHTGGGNIDDPSSFEHNLHNCIHSHGGKIIGHNIKFDMHFSENQGIILGNKVKDTMVREALIDENRGSYSLENVAKHYKITPKLGKRLYEHIGRKFNVKPDRKSMGHFHRLSGNDSLAVEYAGGDTVTTKQLHLAQEKEIYGQKLDLVASIEDELCYVLQKMERRGVIVDIAEAERVKAEVDEMYWEALSRIDTRANVVSGIETISTINVRSGKELKEYFEACEITDWPMTLPTQRHPDGQASFKKDFLLSSQEGLDILNVRKLAHLKNSFLDVLDEHIYNGRIHTTFNQTRGETHGTRSGRLSSSYPNMQQVPKRDEPLGKIYRRIFVPRRDYVFIEYDYSQAEPRLYTHYSLEPSLMEGYNSTPCIDMHMITAKLMGISRNEAKTINLGIMYTMGAAKLAVSLGISYETALEKLKQWNVFFPMVSNYDKANPGFTQKAQKVAENRKYVKTILGRRSRFDDPRFAYRAANRIVQGGSADILKYKMVQIDRYLVDNNLEEVCQMILNIHDSLAFMIHKDYLYLVDVIKEILERVQVPPFNLKVPFIAEYKMGANWSEATYGKDEKERVAA